MSPELPSAGRRPRALLAVVVVAGLAAAVASASWYESPVPPMNGAPEDFAARRAGAEVAAAVRVTVAQPGLCRLTQPALAAAGIPATNLIGSELRLFCRSNEVAVLVSSDGLWATNDFLLFYATGFNGYHSSTNVYWLGFGEGGRRMPAVSAAPQAGVGVVTSYWQTVVYHRDYWYDDVYRPSDASLDHWFSDSLRNGQWLYTALQTDNALTETQAVFGARLHGYTATNAVNPDHVTQVWVTEGNHYIGSFAYDGRTTWEGSVDFDASRLASITGFKFIQSASGVLLDQAFLEFYYVRYRRRLWSDGQSLLFEGQPGANTYRVERYVAGTNFWALDVLDPQNPVRLTGFAVTNSGGLATVSLGASSAQGGRYLVCADAAIVPPAGIQRVAFRGLSSTENEADYLILCPYEFRDACYRLLALRHRQGLKVAVAPLPDVYNEFGYGLADAACIKQFIGFAFHHWRRAPRYVLLAGTGTYDPRHLLYASPEWLPAPMGPSAEKWTALDGWYAQVNGPDKVQDVALGRIPVGSSAQMGYVVDKIVSLESMPTNDPTRHSALLVADRIDTERGYNFRASCEAVRTNGLAGFGSTTAYYDSLSTTLMRDTIVNTLNAGVMTACYFGHGAPYQWAGGATGVFNTGDVYRLVNSDFAVIAMLTCQNGAFCNPASVKCMVEVSLERQGRGASACVAATALTAHQASEALARGFFRALGTERRPRIGDAMLEGYAELFEFGPTLQELLYFELFGDPAMVVNP